MCPDKGVLIGCPNRGVLIGGTIYILHSHTVKSVMCAAHCNLLDMLQICPVGLSEIIDSVDYLDFSACNNRTLLPPSVAPQCLPKPNFIVSSGLESGGQFRYEFVVCLCFVYVFVVCVTHRVDK